ncbi:MAG: VapB-type antitoxin [Thermoprotei archaeon]
MGYVVKVDSKGKIKLPKGLSNAGSVIIIGAGTFFIGIPVPKDPLAKTSGVIKTELSVKELKEIAEREAEKEAVERYKRLRKSQR